MGEPRSEAHKAAMRASWTPERRARQRELAREQRVRLATQRRTGALARVRGGQQDPGPMPAVGGAPDAPGLVVVAFQDRQAKAARTDTLSLPIPDTFRRLERDVVAGAGYVERIWRRQPSRPGAPIVYVEQAPRKWVPAKPGKGATDSGGEV